MITLNKTDKELLSRRGTWIRELNLEKRELLNRICEINKQISEHQFYNRELLEEDTRCNQR